MKKLNLKSTAFNKSEVLTRSQMKKVLGGTVNLTTADDDRCLKGACKLAIQGTDGSWITRDGKCDWLGSFAYGHCGCDVGLGDVPVTSNNGESRCEKS